MSDTDSNSPSLTDQEERNRSDDNAFPVDALPPLLRDLCRGLADLHGVPVQFPAALAIAVVGGAAGKGLQVDTWRGLKTFPNVYVLAGVLSGLAKSTVGTPIFEPLAACEIKHQQEHAEELPMIEAELMLVQKQIAALIKRTYENE
jgi:hypothetical protein